MGFGNLAGKKGIEDRFRKRAGIAEKFEELKRKYGPEIPTEKIKEIFEVGMNCGFSFGKDYTLLGVIGPTYLQTIKDENK